MRQKIKTGQGKRTTAEITNGEQLYPQIFVEFNLTPPQRVVQRGATYSALRM